MAKKKFREYNLDQQYLIPPDIRDWVSEDHFARYISDFVSVLNLSRFEEFHKPGAGQPPYDPTMMLKLILYFSCRGIHSSRQWEKATYDDIGARFLAANQHPDYSCFWNFKRRHDAAIQDLFVQVVACAKQMGLVKLGDIALDGTLLKANASKTRNVLGTEIEAIIAEGEALYDAMVEKWAQADAEEKAHNDDVPEKLKQAKNRLEALREAKAVADQRMAEHHQKAIEVFEAEEQARHANMCSEPEPDGIDLRELRHYRELTQAELGKMTGIERGRLSALETGRRVPSEPEREALEKALGPGVTIRFGKCKAPRSRKPPVKQVQHFINYTDPDSAIISRPRKTTIQGYNAQAVVDVDSHVILGLLVTRETTDRRNVEPMLTELERNGCENFKRLFADSGYFSLKNAAVLAELGIEAFIPPERRLKKGLVDSCPSAQRMREKMQSDEGKRARKRRSTSVEPVFGNVKGPLDFRRFLSRGMANVTTDWNLVGTAHNLLKILKRWK